MEKVISRPLSPHLTIYKPQLTSTLSIFHRISGVVLSLVVFVFSFSYSFFTNYFIFFPFYSKFFAVFSSTFFLWFYFVIISLIIIALHYHASNGIRHLLWDFGFFLDLKSVYFTGIICVFLMIIWLTITVIRILYS